MPSSDLLPYIFSNTRLPIAVQFARWVEESPRFRAFAETYRDKIRKKVRGVKEVEGFGDLQAELATAFVLVVERRFAVEYEKYGQGKLRGPDFSVTFKTHVRFDVEVTRLRGGQAGEVGAAPEPGRLANALCVKVGQMLPSMINVLVLAADGGSHGEDVTGSEEAFERSMRSAVTLLQERLERKDDEFFTRRGFLGARDFYKYYNRLSAVRLVAPGIPPLLRLQPQARHPLPSDLATILRR